MFKKIIYFIFILILIFVIIYIIFWRGINKPIANNGDDVIFNITKGMVVEEIGDKLEKNNLIKSKKYFKFYISISGKSSKLQAGEYLLNPMLSIKEIVEIFIKGEILNKEKTIKIIEGWNIKDIDNYLTEQKIINKDEFISATNEIAKTKQKINMEGYFFPDTYRIFNNSKADDIAKKMLDNFDNKLTKQMRDDIKKQNKTIDEIIIKASIIEKEVRNYDDMKIVAGVFENRIKNGQPLESCATLAYIIGVNKKQYSTEDTNIKSPYNTYKNKGLPPGPICNPGLNAIKASIYAENTGYNYFLNKFDTGETIFSKTYQEHLNNKAKYLK